jgi:hypothetical protein
MTNLTRYGVELMYYPRGNQLVETIWSVTCNVIFNGSISSETTKRESKLIHEHDLVQVTARVKCCITCDSYYCSQCGKLLENEAATLILALTKKGGGFHYCVGMPKKSRC